jgi:hypothetical protein
MNFQETLPKKDNNKKQVGKSQAYVHQNPLQPTAAGNPQDANVLQTQ